MERNGSRGAACLQEPPSSEVLISNMDMTMGSLYAVLTLMAVAGSLVYLEEIIYITRKISPSYKRTTYIWVTGAAPVIAATSCIGMWIPRSSMFTDFTASIYFTICLHKFLVMMVEEYGGDEACVQRLQGVPLKTSTGPCCCCCLCLPPLHIGRRSLTVLKWGTLQAALLRPTLMFFAIVLWTNGTYQQGKMKVNGAFPWITALSVATFILSLWPIGILFSQAKSNLSKHNIVPKFALNQSVAILSQAQGGVISLLVSTGTIVCAPPFSARARGTFMHQQLVVMEMFIVILVARFYYRRRYNDHGIEKPFTKPLAKENVPGDADRQDGGVFMQPLVSSTHWV
ncbi:organic solute transporter subunit alpha-like isoform X1 [Scleropages formosus]|uniref:Organic solute transporter subunit alpha-like n=1 Tax=Scleropages formosus TaxID=113540 RepID=A0A8C9R0X6_SCLFO|nr:organic solute transporter subunit alpha-like isoform X1 [Scleropages formosus]